MAFDPNDWLVNFSDLLTADDTVVCDAGSAYYLCHQRLRLPEGCRLITDLAQGAMGFAIPSAIGAAMAKKNGRVIVITGDGSLFFQAHNLLTANTLEKDITIYVLENGGYKVIKDSQASWCGGRTIGIQGNLNNARVMVEPNIVPCSDYEVRRPVIG